MSIDEEQGLVGRYTEKVQMQYYPYGTSFIKVIGILISFLAPDFMTEKELKSFQRSHRKDLNGMVF